MLNEVELRKLFDDGEKDLTPLQIKSRLGNMKRGVPNYGVLSKLYPTHFASFRSIYDRKKRNLSKGIDPVFSRSLDGFISFVAYMGDIPDGMERPTVGRKDHGIGYFKGNFEWQSLFDNIQEMSIRTSSGNNLIDYRHLGSDRQARIKLETFVLNNKGIYHVLDIHKATDRSCGRRTHEYLSQQPNCIISDYRNRLDFKVEIV